MGKGEGILKFQNVVESIGPRESLGGGENWPDPVGHRVLVKSVLSPSPLSSCVVDATGDWVALCGVVLHDKTLGWVP